MIPVITSRKSSCSWRLIIAYRRFPLTPASKVAALDASQFGGVTKEDWALLPHYHYFFYSQKLVHKMTILQHLKKQVKPSRYTSGWVLPHIAQVGAHDLFVPYYLKTIQVQLSIWQILIVELTSIPCFTCTNDREDPFCVCWKVDWLTLPFQCLNSFPVLALLFKSPCVDFSFSSSTYCT